MRICYLGSLFLNSAVKSIKSNYCLISFNRSALFVQTYSSNNNILRNFSSKMTETNNSSLYYDTVLKLVKECGQLINEKISNRSKTIEVKSSDIDLVTETDQEVEKILIKGLSEKFPDHKFIGEESVAGGAQCDFTDAPTWIIDPIDGTMNFIHSFPHSCISIALFINKSPEIAIIYNPMLNQLFTAQKNKGAYLNGNKITVSNKNKLSECLVMMEFGTSRDVEKSRVTLENQTILMPKVHGLRALGSAALDMAMVALGAADAYFEYGIHIWDFAAGELIVKEAGGVVIDPAGGDIDRLSRRVLAAANVEIADELSRVLAQFYPTPRD